MKQRRGDRTVSGGIHSAESVSSHQSPQPPEQPRSCDQSNAGRVPDYIPPIALVLRVLGVGTSLPEGDRPVTVNAAGLRALLRWMIRDCGVDEQWYKESYPDVARAEDSGQIVSASAHFTYAGYFEGRRPAALSVDDAWYLSRYPDIEEAIRVGIVKSAADHFDTQGYREGRAAIREHQRDSEFWFEAAQGAEGGRAAGNRGG